MPADLKLDISADAILNTVQEKRLKMLLGYEEYDKNSRYLMNELAETAVQVKKIESDEEIAGDETSAALALATVIANMDSNPFARVREGVIIDHKPDLPAIEIKPGETSTENDPLEYDEFVVKR